MQDQLKKIDRNLKLPGNVKDAVMLRMFLGEYFNEKLPTLPVEHAYSGGFLPLFNYSFQGHRSQWNSPALLTWYVRKNIGDVHEKTYWTSIPLLSGGSSSATENVFTVAGPVGYLEKTVKKPEDSNDYCAMQIHPRDTQWVYAGAQVEHTDIYSLCGLLYRGKNRFLVEKEGLPRGAAEKVKSLLRTVKNQRQSIRDHRKCLADRKTKNESLKLPPQDTPQGKIAYYNQQIEMEQIKRDALEIDN